ncbi:hypothetical protein [Salipaludibacillus sp. CF4.18]|uniref:hypothetical protein n=1 Tax=Salipaludibacillus sp. CF4.18 TaxID=3373081 RepID=UPI003EE4ABD8
MNIRPLGNRAVISLLDETNATLQNGIIIPDTVKGEIKRGKVVGIGEHDSSLLQEKDVIIFLENTGVSVKLANEAFIIINEEDVLAVVEDN